MRDAARHASLFGIDDARARLLAGQSALIWYRGVADTETPVSAALKCMVADRGDWLLESVEGGETRGRYSLIGLDPDLIFRANADGAQINRHWQSDRTAFVPVNGQALNALRDLAQSIIMDVPPDLPRALACLVGYFAYETYGLVEKLPRPADNVLGLPDALFVRPTVILIFDRLKDELFVIAPLWADKQAPDHQITDAADRIDAVLSRLAGPLPPSTEPAIDDPVPPRPVLADGQYRNMVLRAQDYIHAGDIFQVVLAQRFTTAFTLSPSSLYRALRRVNPSPFLYFLDLPGFALIGSSPEILVRVRDGDVTIRPIAGTRPRGATPADDQANQASLLADHKECAEHLMLLDLGRNDVGRVTTAGSVAVTERFTVERYSHVMHIVSNVVGRLAPGKDALDALFAGFPAGTVSGAPKVRAAEIIGTLEPETRGAYAGGVGYFAPDGTLDSCIILRTAVLKDGIMHVQAGAGIVADSDPDYEQRECEAKASALFAAAREAAIRSRDGRFGQ